MPRNRVEDRPFYDIRRAGCANLSGSGARLVVIVSNRSMKNPFDKLSGLVPSSAKPGSIVLESWIPDRARYRQLAGMMTDFAVNRTHKLTKRSLSFTRAGSDSDVPMPRLADLHFARDDLFVRARLPDYITRGAVNFRQCVERHERHVFH